MKYPKECPVVMCTECNVPVEITEPVLEVYLNGVADYFGDNCVEAPGWDVEHGCEHGAVNPVPLTPAARDMLAIAVARSLK